MPSFEEMLGQVLLVTAEGLEHAAQDLRDAADARSPSEMLMLARQVVPNIAGIHANLERALHEAMREMATLRRRAKTKGWRR